MTLVDSSIWIDHLRLGDRRIQILLADRRALMHPFVLGEISLGSLANRDHVLEGLSELPQALVAEDLEVLRMIERHKLFGSGVGYLDAHLLASALISNAKIWTRDKRFAAAARILGLFTEPVRH